MSTQQTFSIDALDADILVDLLVEVSELYEASEQTLIELELKPNDRELQRALFRSVHTIKGDLGLVSFRPLLPLMQRVEDLLDYLRNGSVNYTSIMSDLVLIIMDQVKQFVSACQQTGSANYNAELYTSVCQIIEKITPENLDQHEQYLNQAVSLLDPKRAENNNATSRSTLSQTQSFDFHALPANMQEDIIFFRELSLALEKHRLGEIGKSQKLLKLVMSLNDIAGTPLPHEQLMVASYLHDFGHGFIPPNEPTLGRAHVYKSAKLIEHLEHWNIAYEILMQYKERSDGSGYPMGLTDEDIHQGAKLLAVAESFLTLASQYLDPTDDTTHLKKALVAINRQQKSLHCPMWLNTLNIKMAAQLR